LICTVGPAKRTDKRPREWKEIRLAAAQAHGETETFYAATFGSVEELGRRWGHCARWSGWGLNSEIHALGDGAEWIRLQTREVFGSRETSYAISFTSVNTWGGAATKSCRANAPISGAEPNRPGSKRRSRLATQTYRSNRKSARAPRQPPGAQLVE